MIATRSFTATKCKQRGFFFVTHVIVNGNRLEFSPSAEEICSSWVAFSEHLSHSSDRTVYSVNVAFELIRQDGCSIAQRNYIQVRAIASSFSPVLGVRRSTSSIFFYFGACRCSFINCSSNE